MSLRLRSARGVGRVSLCQLGHQALDDLPGGNTERLGGVTNSCLVEWKHGKQRNRYIAVADNSTCVEEHQRMVDDCDERELEPTEWKLGCLDFIQPQMEI
jgi:hypothetical protein